MRKHERYGLGKRGDKPEEGDCWACGEPYATHVIWANGDRDWLMRALALVCRVPLEAAALTVDDSWHLWIENPVGGWRMMPMVLCAEHAEEAQRLCLDTGWPAPAIWTKARAMRADYDGQDMQPIQQPYAAQIEAADEGLVLCWDRGPADEFFTSDDPEDIERHGVWPLPPYPPEARRDEG